MPNVFFLTAGAESTTRGTTVRKGACHVARGKKQKQNKHQQDNDGVPQGPPGPREMICHRIGSPD
jgi:hypothetical protein